MESYNLNDLYQFFLIALAICGAISIVGKAVDVIKAWRKPHQDSVNIIDNTKQRMDDLESDVVDIKDGQRHMCICLKALIEHALHDGNTEELSKAASGIDAWLIERR